MLEEYLVQECELITTTRDEYGDYMDGTRTTLACRFRDISVVDRGSHIEYNDTDAQLWLSPDTTVAVGNIISFEDNTYQVERYTKARRLGETEIQFIKCDLKRVSIGIS